MPLYQAERDELDPLTRKRNTLGGLAPARTPKPEFGICFCLRLDHDSQRAQAGRTATKTTRVVLTPQTTRLLIMAWSGHRNKGMLHLSRENKWPILLQAEHSSLSGRIISSQPDRKLSDAEGGDKAARIREWLNASSGPGNLRSFLKKIRLVLYGDGSSQNYTKFEAEYWLPRRSSRFNSCASDL